MNNLPVSQKVTHFVAGLPRSGSTLLSGILRQNPRFHAGVSSPVSALVESLQRSIAATELDPLISDAKRACLLKGVLSNYYADLDKEVIFDTNRNWTGKIALVRELFPQARLICCVRDVGWIINSIEFLLAKNPLPVSRLFSNQSSMTVYSRAEELMNSDRGLVGLAWSNLRSSWFSMDAHRLIVVRYNSLVQNPTETIEALYRELGEEAYSHDFENVDYQEDAYDNLLRTPGLHTVRRKVEYSEKPICIPPDLFSKYAGTNFWERPELNRAGIRII